MRIALALSATLDEYQQQHPQYGYVAGGADNVSFAVFVMLVACHKFYTSQSKFVLYERGGIEKILTSL